MYRILIVDDEAYIVQGLIGLIQKTDDLHLEVYKAYSAHEALDWLSRTKIDIVLSDISMPGMDGLALHKEIIRLWPHCHIIFLTGYSDFEYVKEAVRNQAVDYILKAEGDDVILQSIRKAIHLLDKEFENIDLLQQAMEQFQKALPALQKDYLLEVLQHEPRALQQLRSQLAELRIPLLAEQPVLLVIGKVDDWHQAGGASDRTLLQYALQNIAAELLHPAVNSISFDYDRSRIVWLLQPTVQEEAEEPVREAHKRTVRFVEGMLESVQEHCRRILKLKVSFVLAKEMTEWRQAAEKFDALQSLLKRSYYLGQEVLLTEDSFRLELTATHQRAGLDKLVKKAGQLEEWLENGQKEEFFRTFRDLIAETSEQLPASRVVVYHRLVALFISHLNKEGYEQSLNGKWDMARLTQYESHGSWEEAIGYFRYVAEQIFEHRWTDAQQHHHHLVVRIKQYIDDNLAGDLSLTRMGELLSLNPVYLSRLYKQLTGENLTETILEVRLDRAKKLLSATNMKIIDIASQVGFESNAYFHRVFKKAAGLTPHEFRESGKSLK